MIYADGIALLASRYDDMDCKTVRLQTEVARAGMKINVLKTRTFKANCRKREIITLDGKEIEDVKTFTCILERYQTQMKEQRQIYPDDCH